MNIDRLVDMANDIAAFFAADPDTELAAEQVAGHLRRFWEIRMRRQLILHLEANEGQGLSDVARKAVEKLATETQ